MGNYYPPLETGLRRWNVTSIGHQTESSSDPAPPRQKILCVFGTRPEVIKLAPVIRQLGVFKNELQTLTVASGQHTDLLYPFLGLFSISLNFDLHVMQRSQTPNQVFARVLAALDPIMDAERPDLILVQGDTTTALAGALTGFHHGIPVGHVEAGLRSGYRQSPFPEEMNRRLISKLATWHFAATYGNRRNLLSEGVPEQAIVVTGNPVVDSLRFMLDHSPTSSLITDLLAHAEGRKLLVLTTHRRENFGAVMHRNLGEVRRFVESHPDVIVVFPVHPNPQVVEAAHAKLSGHSRILLTQPLDYSNFVHLARHAWLLVSDSGGIQEEAPTLRKPLLILRDNTERPEVVDSGTAMLVGNEPGRLRVLLEQAYRNESWMRGATASRNPFGDGTSARRIAEFVFHQLCPARSTALGIA